MVRRTAEGFGQEADWLEELKHYRDLEEQGRLLVLPCKVGDTVYEIIEETVPNRLFLYQRMAGAGCIDAVYQVC